MECSQLFSEHLQGSQVPLVHHFPVSKVVASVGFFFVQLMSVLPVHSSRKFAPVVFQYRSNSLLLRFHLIMTQRKVILAILRLHVLKVRGVERHLLQLPEKKQAVKRGALLGLLFFITVLRYTISK